MADVTVRPAHADVSYVEWGAVLAGAVVAAALSFVLLTFGASIGLSLVSPYLSKSYGQFAAALAAFWALVVPILSLLVGGYIAGRMRSAWENASADETEFRDGVHGLLVWATSVVIGGVLAFMTAAAAAQTGLQAAATVATDRGAVVAPAVDSLLYGINVAQAPDAGEASEPIPPAGVPQSRTTSTAAPATPGGEARYNATRVMVDAAAAGKLTPEHRQYLAQIVAARTGLPAADAERRVDQAFAQATLALDNARKAAVAAGLVTATALLVGLAAAWYAAQKGGDHRDHNIPARLNFIPRSRPRRPIT